MSKRLKILLLLLVVTASMFFYLLFTSKSLNQKLNNEVNNNFVNIEKTKEQMTTEYKASVTKIISDYYNLDISSTTVSEVEIVRENLFGLTVPAELKDLHLNLVMALTKMEDYLAGNNKEAREESEKIMDQAKLDNNWLVQ